MEQNERRRYLIRYLLNEQDRYQNIQIPAETDEQKQLLRALMNVRMPAEISEEFLSVQNDYLAEVNDKKRLKTDGVAFAGNLVKSPFLKKYAGLKSAARLNLYGAAWDGESSGNIEYKGGYAPEKLVSEINGGFGLVWDGEEYDTCSGSTGKYLSYNNPHKMSLYIISGMPIITWSKAAIADFVQKNDIGITVDSLVDIKEKIDTLSDEKYDVMRKNVFEIAKRLSKGQQLKTIIEKIISEYTADEI